MYRKHTDTPGKIYYAAILKKKFILKLKLMRREKKRIHNK